MNSQSDNKSFVQKNIKEYVNLPHTKSNNKITYKYL